MRCMLTTIMCLPIACQHAQYMRLYMSTGWLHACRLTEGTAQAVHNCIVLLMVCGHPSGAPPCRIHILKTLAHPEHAARLGCRDKDCLYKKHDCLGNR